jgi:hypothetical protein
MYDELESRAALDSDGKLKFEGSKVEAFRALNVSQGYYTEIFDSLTEMGCIEQVRRGAGHQGTVIFLHHKPTMDQFTQIYRGVLTKASPLDTIRQQINDVNRRLPDIDLKSFILSLDQRLGAIEARLDQIERKAKGRK